MPTEIKSPDHLGDKPKHELVERLNKRPIIWTAGVLSVIGLVMSYTLAVKGSYCQTSRASDKKSTEPPNISAFLEKRQSAGVIIADKPPEKNNQNNADTLVQLSPPAPPPPQAQAPDPYKDAQFQMWLQDQQESRQMEREKRESERAARYSDLVVYSNPALNNLQVLKGEVTKNRQASEPHSPLLDLQSESPDMDNYLKHTRVQPVSKYELKAGSVIPSVMLGGINSDLPGQILAQVSQNVYDTSTGEYLLVPQGCKVIGNYDHQVVQGQNRVLIVWHRIIFPDASSVNLGDMPGADAQGYAGFRDKANAHFWPRFRSALMLSAITAGVQMSQPGARQGSTYSSQQMIAGAMGMQMNNLGMMSIYRQMNQPPTLTIRPGFSFNVIVNKDVILPPWHDSSSTVASEDTDAG